MEKSPTIKDCSRPRVLGGDGGADAKRPRWSAVQVCDLLFPPEPQKS